MNGIEIPIKFHIVPNDFNIGADGISGKDFLKKQQCDISYRNMSLSIVHNNIELTIPLNGGPDEDKIMILARCEVARVVKIKNPHSKYCFIDSREVSEGVIISKTITSSENPTVKFINTTSTVQMLKLGVLETESLDNYKIFTIDEIKRNKERTK